MGNRLSIKGCVFFVMAAVTLLFCGCAEKYEPKDASSLKSVELASMYDVVNGYHIPGLTWDMKKKDVEEKIQASLGNASQGLEKTYYLENDDIEKINDKVTSNIDYAFSPKGTLVNITYNFYMEDYTSVELDDLYEWVKGEFICNYGEADDVVESMVEQGNIVFYTETVKWEKKQSDGRITSLQVAKANRGAATEVVSVGTTIYSDEGEKGK